MEVCYDRLWKLLIDKKMKKVELMRQAGISSNALKQKRTRIGRSDWKNMWHA